jgi:1,4-dihydroxy-6-naphthoate synthase
MPLIQQDITVAISPCPNDTFAFYHFFNDSLNHQKYKPVFYDIEELNEAMLQGKYDITKASFPALLNSADQYEQLESGSAIGLGVGPIVVFSSDSIFNKPVWNIGLPGKNTTANFLWNYFARYTLKKLPPEINFHYMNFADVMKKTVSGELDAGVVIHEGRFVYQQMGLKLFEDLGDFWQNNSGFPVPLGGIFIRKNLSPEIKTSILQDLQKSVESALLDKQNNSSVYHDEILPFIRQHSQETDLAVIEKHIEYYVNTETVIMSETSKKAIEFFLQTIKSFGKDET